MTRSATGWCCCGAHKSKERMRRSVAPRKRGAGLPRRESKIGARRNDTTLVDGGGLLVRLNVQKGRVAT